MSAKDKIVEVLKANRDSYTINDDMRVTDPIVLEEDFEKVADQILDSLPRLSGEISSEYILEKLNEDEFDAELYLFLDDEEVTFRNAEYQETRICMLEDLCNEIIKKVVTKICSLVPEQQTVQEFAEEVFGGKMRNLTKEESELIDNHIKKLYKEDEVPAGKVIAEGKYDGLLGEEKDGLTTITISFKHGKINNKLDDNMFGKEGKLVWVPDKEDNG